MVSARHSDKANEARPAFVDARADRRHDQPGARLPQHPLDPLELVRMIATARILIPRARVRLSAGRLSLSREAQLLC
ncbi:hypothetical protein, partial [Staphylococcus aureus]|uniref:hypothetical protein n=1 Tax=Staphylococcus aureus TaxID=1280 RepID=UPI003F82404C